MRGFIGPKMLTFPVFRCVTLTYNLWVKFPKGDTNVEQYSDAVDLTPCASTSTRKRRNERVHRNTNILSFPVFASWPWPTMLAQIFRNLARITPNAVSLRENQPVTEERIGYTGPQNAYFPFFAPWPWTHDLRISVFEWWCELLCRWFEIFCEQIDP